MALSILGYAAQSATTPLAPHHFQRRDPRPDDVVIDILYCGVCHTDIHQARNEWHGSVLSDGAGPRDRRPRQRRRRQGEQVQARRHGRRRLHGGFLPALRRRARTAWNSIAWKAPPSPITASIAMTACHPRRLLRAHRGVGQVRGAHLRQARSESCRAAAVRRHHHLVAAAPLEGGQGQQGRRGRPGRPGPHGPEVRQGDGRGRDAVHPLTRARKPKRAASARTHVVLSTDAAADGGGGRQFDFILDTVPNAARPQPLSQHAQARRRLCARGPARSARPAGAAAGALHRRRRSIWPARSSAASPRPRRCWISAASTASSATWR